MTLRSVVWLECDECRSEPIDSASEWSFIEWYATEAEARAEMILLCPGFSTLGMKTIHDPRPDQIPWSKCYGLHEVDGAVLCVKHAHRRACADQGHVKYEATCVWCGDKGWP